MLTNDEAIKNIKEHCYFANLIPQAKESLDMAIKSLEDSRWIPVTARLPEKTGRYLATRIDADTGWKYVFTAYFCEGDKEFEYGCDKITAWMPLQSPYEEGE